MIFNVQVEIDWLYEGSLESTFQDRLVDALVNKMVDRLEGQALDQLGRDAQRLLTAKTEMLINGVLEKPVSVSTGWGSSTQYDSLYDMIESNMTDLYTGKLGTSGQCKKDPLLGQIESYVKSEVDRNLAAVQKFAISVAKEQAQKEVNEHALIQTLGVVVEQNARGDVKAKQR